MKSTQRRKEEGSTQEGGRGGRNLHSVGEERGLHSKSGKARERNRQGESNESRDTTTAGRRVDPQRAGRDPATAEKRFDTANSEGLQPLFMHSVNLRVRVGGGASIHLVALP